MEPAAAPAVALPLTAEDLSAAAKWQSRFRAAAMRLRVEQAHDNYLDVVEISEPWPSPGHDGTRWMVGRDQWGIWIDDAAVMGGEMPDHWAWADTMDEALELVWQAAEAERQVAIAAIPVLTTGTLDTLLAGISAQRGEQGRAM